MRLWSINPQYLDGKGLVALWRETLLAKNVLLGNTKGYVNHPQLVRFKQTKNPVLYINTYLNTIYQESIYRGYNFNIMKIDEIDNNLKINVTSKQLEYEFTHLQNKLIIRDNLKYLKNCKTSEISSNSMFNVVQGQIEQWERVDSKNNKTYNHEIL